MNEQLTQKRRKFFNEKRRNRIKGNYVLYIMALPGFVYMIINNYIPMGGLIVAFKKFNYRDGLFGSPWCGIQNFRYLFISSDILKITRNTIFYNLLFIVLNMIIPVAVAILLNEVRSKAFLRTSQTLILLPRLISWVIISYVVFGFLSIESGFINKTILPIFGAEPVRWYSEPGKWPFIIPVVRIWQNIGYNTIIYLSVIIGIDVQLFESAKLDGATKLKQIWHITIPMIRPAIILIAMIAVGKMFHSDFGLFYQVPMNIGVLYPTTNVLDTFVYRTLLQVGDIGMSSAAGMFQSVVGFIVVYLSNKAVQKIDSESAVF